MCLCVCGVPFYLMVGSGNISFSSVVIVVGWGRGAVEGGGQLSS